MCVCHLAWVLCDVIQAGGQQVVLQSHEETPAVLVGEQRGQVSGHQGKRQQAAILDQLWKGRREAKRERGSIVDRSQIAI